MEHFNLNSTRISVPTGASAYDENGKATKGRTCAKQYMPNKPTKYAIRFYASVNSEFNYCFSIFDNGKGNKSGINPCTRYSNVHHELRVPNIFFSNNNKYFDLSKTNALFVGIMAHAIKKNAGKYYSRSGK